MIKNVKAETITSDLKLTSNRTESIVVKSGDNITIDLNGYIINNYTDLDKPRQINNKSDRDISIFLDDDDF